MSKQENPNERTVASYNKNVKNYLINTSQSYKPHSRLLAWIDSALSYLPEHGSILEVGSATPRDARYMRTRGYTVQCSDATSSFVTYLREQGEQPISLNLLTDPIEHGYDMIFANAVIQHFTRDDLKAIFEKIYAALKPGSIFAFSTKIGTGEAWIDEKFDDKRYVCYWLSEELASLTDQVGFETLYADTAIGDVSDYDWRMIVARKPLA